MKRPRQIQQREFDNASLYQDKRKKRSNRQTAATGKSTEEQILEIRQQARIEN